MIPAFRDFLGTTDWGKLLRELYPNPQGFDRDPCKSDRVSRQTEVESILWRKMAGAGLLRFPAPEVLAGDPVSVERLVCGLEETGRVLLPVPYLVSVILGAMALAGGRGKAASRLLRQYEKGSVRLTLAIDGSWMLPDRLPVTMTVRPKAGRYVLSGTVSSMLDPHAHQIFVPAFHANDKTRLSIFVVSRNDRGVDLHEEAILDRTRTIARLSLRDAQVSTEQMVGQLGRAEPLVEAALLRCWIGLSAEMVGMADHIQTSCLAYARERRLAGRPIASFQAVAHRLADLHARIELTRPLVRWAAQLTYRRSSDARAAASMAKAAAGDLSLNAVETGLRIHGARGITWDHWLHLYHRRILLDRQLFGSPDLHRELVARRILSDGGRAGPLDFAGEIP